MTKTRMNVTIDPKLKQKATLESKKKDISVSRFITLLVRDHFKRKEIDSLENEL